MLEYCLECIFKSESLFFKRKCVIKSPNNLWYYWVKVQDYIRNLNLKVRPKVPFLNSFNFKKFTSIAKHLRRVPFKILLKIYNERPDYQQWLIDVSGQRTSMDSTMSIPTLKLLKNPSKSGKFGHLGFWIGFLVNFMWQYNPRLMTIYYEIPDFVQLQGEISDKITSMKLHC